MADNEKFRELGGYALASCLEYLGQEEYDGQGPNPITTAVGKGEGPTLMYSFCNGSEMLLSVVATCAQMMKYNRSGGPEGDHKCKALRRHWYSWYKGEFAQPLALALDQYETTTAGVKQIDDRKWAALLSKTYSRLVDKGVTYKDLWVEDASRMMQRFNAPLTGDSFIVVAVEKDSLFGDFKAACGALGATALISGKGKNSRAATEKMLRDYFGWHDDRNPLEDGTLRVIHVSDWDYDGEEVIGPTFAEQTRRYTGDVAEARIGIMPAQVPEDKWESRSYQIKVSHSGSKDWAAEHAIFGTSCEACGAQWLNVGSELQTCPKCGTTGHLKVDKKIPNGFEVEALPTRTFYGYFVDALLQLYPFDDLVSKLRTECVPDGYTASSRVADELLSRNQAYTDALEQMREMQDKLDTFKQKAMEALQEDAETRLGDYVDMGDDPTPEQFRGYVQQANEWSGPWRPFDGYERTEALKKDLLASDVAADIATWEF